MRYAVLLFGLILCFAYSAGAQVISGRSLLLSSSAPGNAGSSRFAPAAMGVIGAARANDWASSEPAGMPQRVEGVQGGSENSTRQVSIGYAFVRFYAVPGTTVDTNGLTASVVYYYKGGWFGGDGELLATFGSQTGNRSQLLLGAGGVRVRWPARRGPELWAHALAGGSRYSP